MLSKLLLHSYPRAVRNVVDTLVVDICLAYFALQTTADGSWGRKAREREEGEEKGGREGERKRGKRGGRREGGLGLEGGRDGGRKG